ncbi:MAG: mechanosensitive ion channel family protein [Candidatus Zixiibacteriota bacterium]
MDFLAKLAEHDVLLRKILSSLVVILIVFYLSRLLRRWAIKFTKEASGRYQVGKAISFSSIIFTIIVVAVIWIDTVGNFGSFLGIIGAGIAVALRDPLTSIAGWLYLRTGKLYNLGDRVQLGDIKGDVVDIATMRTTLIEIENWVDGEQATGRLVHVPNGILFEKQSYNYTKASNYIWTEVSVVITFESNWKKAMDITTGLIKTRGEKFADKAKKQFLIDSTQYLIKHGTLTPISYLRIVDSGVKINVRFLVPVRQRRNLESGLQEDILEAFAKYDDITLAYTTYRITKN